MRDKGSEGQSSGSDSGTDFDADPGKTVRSVYEAARRLQDDRVKDIDRLCEIAVDSLTDIVDLPFGACWIRDEEEERLNLVKATESADEFAPTEIRRHDLEWDQFESDGISIYDVSEVHPELPVGSGIMIPVGEHGLIGTGAPESSEETEYDDHAVNAGKTVASLLKLAIDQRKNVERLQRSEEILTSLHETTRELIDADDADEVAQRIVKATKNVLGFPANGVRFTDDDSEELVIVSSTSETEEVRGGTPTYPVHDSLAGKAYRESETYVFDDIREVETEYDRKDVRSVMYVPIEGYGTVSVGETHKAAFDDSDVRFVETLARNAKATLDRIKREKELRVLNSELKERQKHLEVFDRVLRHNMHNKMNIILGYSEELSESESLTDDERRYAEKIREVGNRLLDTTDKERELVEIISDRSPPEEVDIAETVERRLSEYEERYPEAEIEVHTPDSETTAYVVPQIPRAVDELVNNAVEHNDTETPRVSVEVEKSDTSVEIRVSDNGSRIPDSDIGVLGDEREIEPLYHGSGLGLWLVHWIVKRSGGDLEFEDREPRGTVVTVRLRDGKNKPLTPVPSSKD
ncbi:GAF domain-containing protein [Halorutilales archaeon Cl-col2-1]